MRIYDLTLPLRAGMIAFPGDPEFGLRPVSAIADGGAYNLSQLTMGSHTGTHVDPPAHYIQGGPTVEMLPLERLMGPCVVLDLRGCRRIGRAELAAAGLAGQRRVLLRTDNGDLLEQGVFAKSYAALSEAGARFLLEAGVELLGVDYLTPEDHADGDSPLHRLLLGAGVIIVECLRLGHVPPGDYELICLPLPVQGGDGAPARVVLRELADQR